MAGGIALGVSRAGVTAREQARVRAVNGDTLEIAGLSVRLFGLVTPQRGEICRRGDGSPYDCGRFAANFMRRLLDGKQIVCRAQARQHGTETSAVCYADGVDIGRTLVRAGWALATPTARLYRADEKRAQAARRGLWAGSLGKPGCRRSRAVRITDQRQDVALGGDPCGTTADE